ncbi:hypothetical protein O181_024590 [Austropuccinia psidii MF-1]|uniref:Zn(2)-C6 fungal-type domain-containing protein n=1 Tax=Austropuccinia psidii MF-1 TaxID=1389203 RepID=A0A9Q3CL66_9BASI|nr:hypothetical protein [Austropuccinia psidii MF-1]
MSSQTPIPKEPSPHSPVSTAPSGSTSFSLPLQTQVNSDQYSNSETVSSFAAGIYQPLPSGRYPQGSKPPFHHSRDPPSSSNALCSSPTETSRLARSSLRSKKSKMGARASIACETCRRRKVRCSGDYPICSFCLGRQLPCVYDGHPLRTKALDPPPSAPTAHEHSSLSVQSADSLQFNLDFPKKQVIQEAINAFLVHFVEEGFFTFFHRPTLIRQMESDLIPPEILFSILCLAGRFCKTLKALNNENIRNTCSFYGDKALSLIQTQQEELSLSRIQVHLMLGFYYCTENNERRGWMLIGAAIRMSQLLKLGHLDDDDCFSPSTKPACEEEVETGRSGYDRTLIEHDVKRRTFWACFFLERIFADGKERFVMINVENDSLKTRFPISESEFILGRWMKTEKFSSTSPPWGAISKNLLQGNSSGSTACTGNSPREVDLFGQLMRISELWHQVLKYVSSGGRNKDRRCPWLSESTFSRLDELLSEWEMYLPPHMQYCEANLVAYSMIGRGKTYGLIHLLYFTSLLYLHRDYMPFLPPLNYQPKDGPIDGDPLWHPNNNIIPPNPEWWQTSAETCFRAANAVTDLFISLDYRGCRLTTPFAGFSILTAATMHVHLWFWPGSSSKLKNSGEYLALDTRILNDFKQAWFISDQWCQALNMRYALNSLIHHNECPKTPISPPLSLIRAGLMKIINTRTDDTPIEKLANSSNQQSPDEGFVETSKRCKLNSMETFQVVPSSPKKVDCSLPNVVEIVGQTHNIFEENWPEPRLLENQTCSFIGVNHRRQQEEHQQHYSRMHSALTPDSLLRSPSSAHLSSPCVYYEEKSAENSQNTNVDNEPQSHTFFEEVSKQSLTNNYSGQCNVEFADDLAFGLNILSDWNAINLLNTCQTTTTNQNNDQTTSSDMALA